MSRYNQSKRSPVKSTSLNRVESWEPSSAFLVQLNSVLPSNSSQSESSKKSSCLLDRLCACVTDPGTAAVGGIGIPLLQIIEDEMVKIKKGFCTKGRTRRTRSVGRNTTDSIFNLAVPSPQSSDELAEAGVFHRRLTDNNSKRDGNASSSMRAGTGNINTEDGKLQPSANKRDGVDIRSYDMANAKTADGNLQPRAKTKDNTYATVDRTGSTEATNKRLQPSANKRDDPSIRSYDMANAKRADGNAQPRAQTKDNTYPTLDRTGGAETTNKKLQPSSNKRDDPSIRSYDMANAKRADGNPQPRAQTKENAYPTRDRMGSAETTDKRLQPSSNKRDDASIRSDDLAKTKTPGTVSTPQAATANQRRSAPYEWSEGTAEKAST